MLQWMLVCRAVLVESQRKVARLSDATLSLYRRYSSQLSMDALTTGAPLWPPTSTMLEWVVDVDHHFHQEYPFVGIYKA